MYPTYMGCKNTYLLYKVKPLEFASMEPPRSTLQRYLQRAPAAWESLLFQSKEPINSGVRATLRGWEN